MRLVYWLLVPLLALAAPLGPAQALDKPPPGSDLRKAILDAARPTFEKDTGGPIEFVVTTLNVLDGWAYGDVKLQRPGGRPIDWSRTQFGEDYAQGMFDPEHNLFLLKRQDGGWALVEYALGPTDVAWDWWRQQYNIPQRLFEE